jgi:hypothetical protein
MNKSDSYQKISLYCLVFTAVLSAVQTGDNMEDRKWRRTNQEEREEHRAEQ